MFTKMVDKLLDWIDSLHGMAEAVFVVVCLVLMFVLVLAIIVMVTTMKQCGIPFGTGLLVIIGLVALISIIVAVLVVFSE